MAYHKKRELFAAGIVDHIKSKFSSKALESGSHNYHTGSSGLVDDITTMRLYA